MPLEEIIAASSNTTSDKATLAVFGSLLAVGQTSNIFRQFVEACLG